jgi:SpoVK/Ycf46/Vps4 family AAA+-type ATPase
MAPCLLLLDNLEIILGGDKGGGMRGRRTAHIALDRLLSTLLVEIDGLASVEEAEVGSYPPAAPVIVIATTTDISALDKALIRPGRLEEHISLQHPSLQQRTDLISHLVARFDLSLFSGPPSPYGVSAVVERLATATQGRSQAEIVSLVQEASFRALSAKIRSSSQDQGGGAVEQSLQDCFFPHT